MRKEMNKEQWIDEIIDSTKGMHKADPGAGFYDQVLLKLNRPATIKGISMPVKQWAAAAILLLALNIGSIVYFMDGRKTGGMPNNPLASELQLESTYNY